MKFSPAVLFADEPGLAPVGDGRLRLGSTPVRAELVEAAFAASIGGSPTSRGVPGLVEAPPQIKLAKALPSAFLTDEP